MKKIIFSLFMFFSFPVDAYDKVTTYIQETYNISREDAFKIHTYSRNASIIYKVPLQTILAIIETESSFQNRSKSRKNSKGLMQIHPSSGVAIKNVYNPYENILKGTKLFSTYREKLGHDIAIHAYNLGITNIRKGVRNKNYFRKIKSKEKMFASMLQKLYNASNNN